MHWAKQFFYLLRPSHWTKGSFVLLGVIYSGQLKYLPQAFLAAFAFCCIASAVYIYNDIQDLEEDRLHPRKCKRLLASNQVSLNFALGSLLFLLILGLGLGFAISQALAVILATYLLVNLIYNHFLKNFPILDVLCIATGFMLRVLAGTLGLGLSLSFWLTMTATLMSLFIALCKRRLEKQMSLEVQTRKVLQKYKIDILDELINWVAIATFAAYAFYTFVAKGQSFYFLLTLPFSALALKRFIWLSEREMGDDDPLNLFFQDNLSRLNAICFLFLTFVALSGAIDKP